MKRMVSALVALLLCVLLMGEAFAIVLPEHLSEEQAEVGTGTAIVEATAGPLEVSDYLGKTEAEFMDYIEENGKTLSMDAVDMNQQEDENGEMVSVVAGFAFRRENDCGLTIFGYDIDGRYSYDLRDRMEADGWTCVRKDFEGGLEWFRFEKTVGDQVYRFELNGCDGVVTYLALLIK